MTEPSTPRATGNGLDPQRTSRTAAPWRRVLAGALAGLVALTSVPAFANKRPSIIRDAEIETLLRDYAEPVFEAAGIRKGQVRIILIGDRSFNAFVTDGRRMFINVGAIMDARAPNELIGVIAHEAGHIAGGHLVRLREQAANAQILAVVGMLLGAGAVAGAAASGDRVGSSGIGTMGAVLGPTELVRRSMLSYQRAEEQAADRAAITYLDRTGQSAKGLLETFRRFHQESMFKTTGIDPYTISHPLPADRIANLETLAAKSAHLSAKDPPALVARHELARAKLFGFVANADEVARRYPARDVSLPARYARAIVDYRYKRLSEALTKIDALLAEQPNNAYFWELKGQALLEFGRAQESVPALRRAVSLAPGAVPIRVMLGHALVSTERPAAVDEAIRELSNAVTREPDNAEGFRHLATAYGIKGNVAMAELSSAQYYFTTGDLRNAVQQAARAQDKFPKNSASWLKAEEILTYRPPR